MTKKGNELPDWVSVLFNCSQMGYLLVDKKGIILDSNHKVCCLLKHTEYELKGIPLVGFVHREDQLVFLNSFRTKQENSAEEELRLRLLKSNETILYANITIRELCEFPGRERGKYFLLAIMDKTQEHILQEESKAKERQFLTLFNQPSIGIAVADPEGIFLRVNKRFAGIIGYLPEEVEGLNFREITHPDDLDEDNHLNAEIIAGIRENFEFEKRYKHKDGHYVWIRLYSSIVRNRAGNPLYGLVTIVDISEQKNYLYELEKYNLELQDSIENQTEVRERLEKAEETGSFGSFYFDINSGKGWWSRNQYKIRGWKPDEKEPGYQQHMKTVHPEDRWLVEKLYDEILAGDVKKGSFDYRMELEKGEIRYIHSEYSIERDEQGRALRISGIDQDITDRKILEMQLRDSEDKFKILTDTIQDIIISLDLEGKITYINNAGCSFFGFKREQAIGKSIDIILPEDKRQLRLKLMEKIVKYMDYKLQRTELSFTGTGGNERILQLTVKPMLKEEDLFGLLVVARDITRFKEMESELIKYRILKRNNSA